MAQTSSAAREPSMEEILASIRRIIEDSDVVRQSVPPKPERPHVAPVRGEIAEFRRDPEPVLRSVQVVQPVQPVQTAQAAPRRVEIEEAQERHTQQQAEEAMNALAARIGLRGSLDARGEAAMQTAFKPDFTAIEEDDEPDFDAVNDDLPARAGENPPARTSDDLPNRAETLEQAHITVKPDVGMTNADAAAEATDGAERIEEPESMVVEQGPQFHAAQPSIQLTPQPGTTRAEPAFEEAATPYVKAEAAPILSQDAGRQVAAAFEDLTTAMRMEQRRSFDEMAEKMLRPMLQDWLDNNLPSLVERLVREEIERVVRGGRG